MTYHSNSPCAGDVIYCPCGRRALEPYYVGPWRSRQLVMPLLCSRCYAAQEEDDDG